ncbi:MAG: OmpH family outer membrane protein [Zetaproteobacteria bacterium]|nr:OmpH family outer membrane protein [Zetaproteobacteria bacterium]
MQTTRKTWVWWMVVGMGVLTGFSLQAKSKTKYGLVDIQRIIDSVPEGVSATKELEKMMQEKKAEFSKRGKEIEELRKKLEAQATLLSETARLEKQKEIEKKMTTLGSEQMQVENEVRQTNRQVTQKIAAKAQKIVSGIAAQKDLEMVYESRTSGLVYIADYVDITEDVIKAFTEGDAGEASIKVQPREKISKK